MQAGASAVPLEPYVPLQWHLPLAIALLIAGLACTAHFGMCAYFFIFRNVISTCCSAVDALMPVPLP